MNDFTKDELKIIKNAVNYYLGANAGRVIKEKLTSLIKNYCEHENKESVVLHENSIVYGNKCLKCRRIV